MSEEIVGLLTDLRTEIRALRSDMARRERGALQKKEAAAFVGVSDRTLDKLVNDGLIRVTRLSDGRRGFRVEELERYLRDREEEAVAQAALEEATEDDLAWLERAKAGRGDRATREALGIQPAASASTPGVRR